jgi:hypothetical protein
MLSLALVSISSLVPSGVRGQTPVQSNAAGLVIRYENGASQSYCVDLGPDGQLTGDKLLLKAPIAPAPLINYESGAYICKIGNDGCNYPAERCDCKCPNPASNCQYWTYWKLEANSWVFSNQGAAQLIAKPGDVQAWVWKFSAITDSLSLLPNTSFAEICAAQVITPTPTLPPTVTPTPASIAFVLIATATTPPTLAPTAAATAPTAANSSPIATPSALPPVATGTPSPATTATPAPAAPTQTADAVIAAVPTAPAPSPLPPTVPAATPNPTANLAIAARTTTQQRGVVLEQSGSARIAEQATLAISPQVSARTNIDSATATTGTLLRYGTLAFMLLGLLAALLFFVLRNRRDNTHNGDAA